MGGYAVILVVAAVSTWLLTFAVRRAAARFNFIVLPGEGRVHTKPLAQGGGAGMYLGFLIAMAVASQMHQFKPVFNGNSEPVGVIIGASIIFAVGLADDARDMSPPAKMSGQVLAGSVLALLGVAMLFIRIPFGGYLSLSSDWQPLVTVLWVAGMSTAVNFIDGLDGLAAGIVAIAALGYFFYGDRLFKAGIVGPENVGPLVAIIVVGICLGFLPHNFHPAKIIMGDAGALFLGLLMAASTLLVVGQTDADFSGKTFFFFAPIFIPFFILGIPILDTAFAIIRRAGKRSSPAERDIDHLHHRLMRLGHGHRRTVVILWAWTAVLSGLVLYPTFTKQGNAVIPIVVVAFGVGLYTGFHPGIRRRNGVQSDAAEAAPVHPE